MHIHTNKRKQVEKMTQKDACRAIMRLLPRGPHKTLARISTILALGRLKQEGSLVFASGTSLETLFLAQ